MISLFYPYTISRLDLFFSLKTFVFLFFFFFFYIFLYFTENLLSGCPGEDWSPYSHSQTLPYATQVTSCRFQVLHLDKGPPYRNYIYRLADLFCHNLVLELLFLTQNRCSYTEKKINDLKSEALFSEQSEALFADPTQALFADPVHQKIYDLKQKDQETDHEISFDEKIGKLWIMWWLELLGSCLFFLATLSREKLEYCQISKYWNLISRFW